MNSVRAECCLCIRQSHIYTLMDLSQCSRCCNCRRKQKGFASSSCLGSKPAGSPGPWCCPAVTPTRGTTSSCRGTEQPTSRPRVVSLIYKVLTMCLHVSAPLRYLVTPSLLKVSADALRELGWREMERVAAFPGLTDANTELCLCIPGGGITKGLYTDR